MQWSNRLQQCFIVVGMGILVTFCALPRPSFAQDAADSAVQQIDKPAYGVPQAPPADTDEAARLIVERTNAFRETQDRQPLATTNALTGTAGDFARYMAQSDRYGHTADGRQPAERVDAHGYDYCVVLENIAYEYSSAGFDAAKLAEVAVEGWKNSPGHRRNMLDEYVIEMGAGVAYSEETGHYYAVQVFARPQSAAFEFTVTNRSDRHIRYQVGDREVPLPPRATVRHRQCVPTELTFTLPQGTRTLTPGAGDDVRIIDHGGGVGIQSRSNTG